MVSILCPLPVLLPFKNIYNSKSHGQCECNHVQEVSHFIETEAGGKLHYLPPCSPELN